MFTFMKNRPRVSAGASAGAMERIATGAFGLGTPELPGVVNDVHAVSYHEGDIFTPGAMNFVPESPFELPIVPIWGHGMMLLNGQQFNPYHPAGAFVQVPGVTAAGLGGLVTGGIQFEPLLEGASSGETLDNFAPQF